MKRKKKSNKVLIAVIIFIVVLTITSMIIYPIIFKSSSEKPKTEIKNEYKQYDLNLKIFLNQTEVSTMPEKSDNISFSNLECPDSVSWDDENWQITVDNKKITKGYLQCNIYFEEVTTGELTIELKDGMIPVAFDKNGKTIKADSKNTDNNWYDYENYKWANMVLVTEDSRSKYQTSKPGIEILEDDILTYFVWIPRYKYKLFNAQNGAMSEKTISIEFQTIDDEKFNGTKNGEWLTHPAFTFGDTELSGFWIGKFMTNPDPNSGCYKKSNVTNCDVTNITPRIKPNMDAWRNIKVSNLFTMSQYVKTNPMYGLSKSEIDSHMMKNIEWGAVAYLSQSTYGKRTNKNYTGRNIEVYINNYRIGPSKMETKEVLTGCSSGTRGIRESSTTCAYKYPDMSLAATGASTTGTIYGLYDMNGASMEYVMGNMVDSKGNFFNKDGGNNWGTFGKNLPEKYYDSYEYDTSPSSHYRGHLGDATREIIQFARETIGGWYYDASYFPDTNSPWFTRGGHAASGNWAGVFRFVRERGQPNAINTTRIILVQE